jgi:trehalose 6-phosphate synthase/phosphatase
MSQVLIVSNRLPVSVKKENGELSFYPSVGGLATGLASYVKNRKNKWIGWPGIASDDLTDKDKQRIVAELAHHNCSPVFLTKKQIQDYYNGYSNALLWPLFHDLPFDDKDREQHDRWWRSYRSVNHVFADAVLSLAQADSRIWVHDYQLLLLPELLRAEDIAASIGFFLHIPFPSGKRFSELPERRRLLKGMLGADLIGFHTIGYVDNFMNQCRQIIKAPVGLATVTLADHEVRVGDFPMGIDYEKYAAATESRTVKAAVKRYRSRYRGKKVIAAVDRLDPSKGLVERLEAYKQLLLTTPKLHGKVVFSMIAAPSRTELDVYKKLAKRLTALVDDINARFGNAKWQPVDFINTAQPFEEVAALFSVADVAFIAPLKDGMNLAAKEFVASKRKSGALVLSRTAGAAEELRDALIVNPLQRASLVAGLQKALTMPKLELRTRLQSMQRQLATNTVQHWAKSFVDTLQQPVPGTPIYTRTLAGKFEQKLLDNYRTAKKRLLLLDYDGTLAPFTEDYQDAKPTKTLLQLLEKLHQDPRNEVVLISGRSANDLRTWFGQLPISLVAEHGAVVRRAGHNWQTMTRSETKWKRAVEPILEKYTALTPNAQLEFKPHSLVWHYRGSPSYYAQKHSVAIKRLLKPIIKTYSLRLFQGNKILEIKDPHISKGAIAQRWLRHRYDFILAVGDDFTDEELFAVAPEAAYTIKVGSGRTKARYRLQTNSAVRHLLQKLSRM